MDATGLVAVWAVKLNESVAPGLTASGGLKLNVLLDFTGEMVTVWPLTVTVKEARAEGPLALTTIAPTCCALAVVLV